MSDLYFDYNATTPVHPRVLEAMLPYYTEQFGNPSSSHASGRAARQAIATAREQVAQLVNAHPEQVVFTGGATEANNIVMLGAFGGGVGYTTGWCSISAVEHPAVLEPAAVLAERGVRMRFVPVDARGLVDLSTLEEQVRKVDKSSCPHLVSIMLANNETGVIQPVAQAAALSHQYGFLLHTDAAQAVGKIPVDMQSLGVDYLTIAGQKMYAPKGVGALVCASAEVRLRLTPLMFGGGQEGGLRPGTENVAAIAALGEACFIASEDVILESTRQRDMMPLLQTALVNAKVPHVLIGDGAPRLPQTAYIGFTGRIGADIVAKLAEAGVAVSGGAACHSGGGALSGVLQAMGVEPVHGQGAVRISWGRFTQEDDMREFVQRLLRVLEAVPQTS